MTVIKPEMITKNITRHDVLPLSFLKKTAYTGSKRSLRYKLEKTEVEIKASGQAENTEPEKKTVQAENTEPEKKTVLRCYVWNTPFSFDNTPEDEIRYCDFEFSDTGIDEAIVFLNKELDKAERKD